MKTIIYLAISLDGFIARQNDDVSFTYPRSFKNFKRMALQEGNLIIGRRTFELGVKGKNFPFDDVLTVVVTSDPKKIKNIWKDRVIVSSQSPKNIIQMMARKGFDNVLLGGGAMLVGSFLKQAVVDEIYIDIMPIILKNGKKPFDFQGNMEVNLKLLDIKKFSKNEFRVHYKVQK